MYFTSTIPSLMACHDWPPSVLLNAPLPCVPRYTVEEETGSTATALRNRVGSPPSRIFHDVPLSVLFHMSPSPAAQTVEGFDGSTATDRAKASVKPWFAKTHVAPASMLRYTPEPTPGAAKILAGAVGSMA